MLYAAHDWNRSQNRPAQFQVLTVDHGLRPEAEHEARSVAEHASHCGFPCEILTWRPARSSVSQEAARHARHDLLHQAAVRLQLEALCFAHTRDDFAETFLMRLSHGAGLRGLANAAPDDEQNAIRILRPIKTWTRSEVENLLAEKCVQACHDPSNEDTRYHRVRARQALQTMSAVGVDASSIMTTVARLKRANRALDQMAARILGTAVDLNPLGYATIEIPAFCDVASEVQMRVLAATLSWVAADNRPANDLALDQGIEHLTEKLLTNMSQTLRSCLIRTRHKKAIITREPYRQPPENLKLPAGDCATFDNRFEICSSRSIQIEPLTLEEAQTWRRLVPDLADTPVEAIASLPAVRDDGVETVKRNWPSKTPLFPEGCAIQLPSQDASNGAFARFLGKIPAPIAAIQT